MNKFFAPLAAVAALIVVQPAQAVTFDGFSATGSNAANLFGVSASQVSVDFDVHDNSPITVDFTVEAGDAASYSFDSALNFFAPAGFDFVTLTLTDGATFGLGSVLGAFSNASVSLNGAGNVATIHFAPTEYVGGELGSLVGTNGDFVINGNGLAAAGQFQLILSAGTVPEPASWAMMITGFALVGAGLRKRTTLAFA